MCKLYNFILICLCLSFFSACNDGKDDIDPNSAAPVIKFPMEQLNVDLNQVDNLPVVAVIKSEAGLQSVGVKIQTAEGLTEYKTVTEFFNPNAYSLSETPEYSAEYEAIVIEATDRLGNVSTGTLPVSVTDVMERPVITFSPEEIVYDEMEENPTIPRTTFNVSSEAGLTSVEYYLVSSDGQDLLGSVDLDGTSDYSFDELIDYKEGDKGFKVKAKDTYGNITISTMSVTYKAIPVPKLTLTETAISADSDVKTAIPMQIESTRGVHEIIIYRVEGNSETEVLRKTMNGETSLSYSPQVELTNATNKLKVVVSDGRDDKAATGYITTYVDLDMGTIQVGSQSIANSPNSKYPNAYGMASFKDMTSYSVDYAIASEENAKNIDFKFYCFGGSSVPRLYSMDNTEKSSEYSGSTGKLTALPVKTAARFALLSNFDYENATVATISKILSSSITSNKLTPFEVGDVIAFRTGSTSAAGGSRIGIMKVTGMTEAKELSSVNATIRVLTVEVKLPKKK